MRPLALAALLLLVGPTLAAAQDAGTPYDQAIRAAAALQLATRQSRVSQTAHPAVAEDVFAPRRSKRKSEGVTLMIIGGAAVLVGAIAGNTGGAILIVGGVVCAGYGFYLYTE